MKVFQSQVYGLSISVGEVFLYFVDYFELVGVGLSCIVLVQPENVFGFEVERVLLVTSQVVDFLVDFGKYFVVHGLSLAIL